MDPSYGWIDLDAVVTSAGALTPPAPVAIRLTALVSRDDWDMADVVEIASHDPALTARLLRIANSAAYGGLEPLATVRDAVVRLGANQVAAVAVALGARPYLEQKLPALHAAEGLLWRHSVAASLAVEGMPLACGLRPPAEAFSAALLHDIGKVVLCRHLGDDAAQLLERAQQEGGLVSVRAESEILSVDHAELGALIAQAWKLPASLVEAIRLHHAVDQAPDALRDVCEAVYLADGVARTLVPGLGEAPADLAADPALLALAGDAEHFDALCGWVAERLDAVLAAYE